MRRELFDGRFGPAHLLVPGEFRFGEPRLAIGPGRVTRDLFQVPALDIFGEIAQFALALADIDHGFERFGILARFVDDGVGGAAFGCERTARKARYCQRHR